MDDQDDPPLVSLDDVVAWVHNILATIGAAAALVAICIYFL